MENELQRHYAQLLGVESLWLVWGLELELERRRVTIRLEWKARERVQRPERGLQRAIADDAHERTMRRPVWRRIEIARQLDGVESRRFVLNDSHEQAIRA